MPRILSALEFAAVLDGRLCEVDLVPDQLIYAQRLAAHYDLHQAARRFNQDVLGASSLSSRYMEVDPGRRVPNNWDAGLFETWAERKVRLALSRELDSLRRRGLAKIPVEVRA
jgi:hypothetical protein